ncbi:MAG: amidohydrolase family protein [Clostridia bacterium]|nr:amidohydrolase family protein [Clostridia bacterium]
MIIDAHTHVFPERIAENAIRTLETIGKEKAVIGGTANDLINAMDLSGVDKSVILPVVTKPQQFESIFNFAKELAAKKRFIVFAGIHPLCENINKLLDLIAENGFKGVKLHPDYQQTDITDEGYIRILEGCRKRGLIAVIHAGVDPAYPDHVHCPPEASAQVVRELTISEPFIVLAHLGGTKQIDEVESHLIGLPVYMDTSFVLDSIERERVCDLIESHGYERILFATDSPWRNAKQYVSIIKSLPLSKTEQDAILGNNCVKLLKGNI